MYALLAPGEFAPPSSKESEQKNGDGKSKEVIQSEEAYHGDNIVQMFSSNPKHLGCGLMTAGRDLTLGVTAGVASLVVAPVAGGKQDGVAGTLKGTGLGLGGLVAFPVAGVTSALFQVGKGLWNTPIALYHMAVDDAVWDKDAVDGAEWSSKSIQERLAIFEGEREARYQQHQKGKINGISHDGKKSDKKDADVSEMEFYEVLGILPTATEGAIKKAYYKQAMATHPDKHKDDPKAKLRFQAVGEAYQVLGNLESRAAYDKHGRKGVETDNFVNPAVLFSIMFGGEQLEPFIGQLAVATIAEAAADEKMLRASDLERAQRGRTLKLAVGMAEMVKPWLKDEKESFREGIRSTARKLSQQPFGLGMMEVMGKMYTLKSDQYTAMWGIGVWYEVKESTQFLGSQYDVAMAAWDVYAAHNELEKVKEIKNKSKDKDGITDSKVAAAELQATKGMQSTFLRAVWIVTVLDIEATLRSVCDLLLTDPTVEKAQHKKVGEAIGEIGQIFSDLGQGKLTDIEAELVKAGQKVHDTMARQKDEADVKEYGNIRDQK
jgi:curved DNA-binding protein CbpA